MSGRARVVSVTVLSAVLAASIMSTPQPAAGYVYSESSPPAARNVVVESAPNIIVLMLDDHASMDNRILERLPNIKATFLDQGISFSNYWANFSLCCPGRATFLTGQRAKHTGVLSNQAARFDPRVSLATELQGSGYRTMIFGKYFNGTRKLADKTPDGWDDVVIKDSGPYFAYPMWVNGVREYHARLADDYSTDVLARTSLPLLAGAPLDQPLFAFLSPNATHGGFDEFGVKSKLGVAAPRHRGDTRCSAIPNWMPANYNEADVSDKPAYIRMLPLLPELDGRPLQRACETLLSVDEWLGQVVDELKAQQRYENTIFLLTSDNGMGWGSNRILDKVAPHTAEMPLFISWPAVLGPSASIDTTLLSNADIAPTLCEIAGCAMGPFPNGFDVDGQSFAALIDPAYVGIPVRDSIVLEGGGGTVPTYRGLVTGVNHARGQWFFVRYVLTKERELYDLSGGECVDWAVGDPGDPCRLQNVAKVRAGLAKALKKELAREW